ncbi:hypothetical protein FRC12_009167 [Ceratobasidium sp. 428]|nr:hypothetical protein FRC12_009167 [Ceratobasidium sp. 428]
MTWVNKLNSTLGAGEEANNGNDEGDAAGLSRGRMAREAVPPDLLLEDEVSDLDDPVTSQERQSSVNVGHPFGLRIWKPALYKKSRMVNRVAEFDPHSAPNAIVERHLVPGNIIWTLPFGWWAGISFWPLGKYVEGNLNEEDRQKFEEDLTEAEGLQQSHATISTLTQAIRFGQLRLVGLQLLGTPNSVTVGDNASRPSHGTRPQNTHHS